MSLQANLQYTLIATTANPDTTGSYTIIVSGLNSVSLVLANNTSSTPNETMRITVSLFTFIF
jgi:hypothetical protein